MMRCSSAATRSAASGVRSAISWGITTTPCWSPCSRSSRLIHTPPTFTGMPKSTRRTFAWRHEYVRSAELEAQLPGLVQVPHGAICHHSNAPERFVNVGLDLAPIDPLALWLGQVVAHHDARRRARPDG